VKHTPTHAQQLGAAVVPTVRYRDVPAATEWLCKAFGFEQHRLVKDKDGSALYAQLTFGNGMVMVAPIQETAFGKLMVQPDEIGGVETQICYLYVEDAKAHQARASDAGAEIVLDIKSDASAGRGYSCRDPEGHIWNFGTYDPWDLQAAAARPARRRRKLRTLFMLILLGLAAGAIYTHEPAREAATDFAVVAYAKVAAAIESIQAAQAENSSKNESSDNALTELRDQLSKERIARLAADRHVKDIREQLTQERRARELAELSAKEARESQAQNPPPSITLKAEDVAATTQARNELAQVRRALDITAAKLEQALAEKETAERGIREARELLVQLRTAKEAAERAASNAREQANRERTARAAAERAVARKNATPSLFQ
jgi:uncharacterized glyoxalase superfamily protein PhnB